MGKWRRFRSVVMSPTIARPTQRSMAVVIANGRDGSGRLSGGCTIRAGDEGSHSYEHRDFSMTTNPCYLC